VPRRSRGHVYRKRLPAGAQVTPASAPSDEAIDGDEALTVQSPVAAPAQPAPYARTRPVEAAVAAPATRAGRGLITDYGYVVDELKRIGLTFSGLIVLLIVISRFLK
jgi:hypothetical protein